MHLITKELEEKIPKLYETEHDEIKIAVIKYFNPCGAGTWYVIEYDPDDKLFYGFVKIHDEGEYGYFSLEELESIKLPYGLKIERDLYFEATPMNELI